MRHFPARDFAATSSRRCGQRRVGRRSSFAFPVVCEQSAGLTHLGETTGQGPLCPSQNLGDSSVKNKNYFPAMSRVQVPVDRTF